MFSARVSLQLREVCVRQTIRTILASITVLFAFTCGGIDNFTITEESQATIDSGIPVVGDLLGDLGFGGFLKMDISQNEELKNQGVKREQIDSVKIESISLTITSPDDGSQDFTFLDDLEFYVDADGLDKKLIASGANFAAGLTTIGLDVEDVELAPYAAADSMDITTEARGSPPDQDTTILGTIKLNVDVNVSGALGCD